MQRQKVWKVCAMLVRVVWWTWPVVVMVVALRFGGGSGNCKVWANGTPYKMQFRLADFSTCRLDRTPSSWIPCWSLAGLPRVSSITSTQDTGQDR